jgi:hypothetical protein
MVKHLIHIIHSAPYRSGRISALDNPCVISTWYQGSSVIVGALIAFISCSVYLHADISVHDKAHLEYARSGAAKYCLSQHNFGRRIISTCYNPAKHTDRCCCVFTQRLENLNVGDTYSLPTAYHFYTTHCLAWCNAPPTAQLYSWHRIL